MENAIVPVANKMSPFTSKSRTRGDRPLFSTSDDNATLKQIQATHAPDERELDVKPILSIIEDIMHRAHPVIVPTGTVHLTQTQFAGLDDKAVYSSFAEALESLAQPIHKVSCEIAYTCSGGGDAHGTTLAILSMLSSFSWDAKVVIALAAFSVNYGEFWLVGQLYPTNPLARSVAILKQLPEILERAESSKTRFDAISNLVKAMLDVTKCIVEFNNLPPQYISSDTPEMLTATAHIPIAVYWIIRSIVACASQLMNLVVMGVEYIASTAETWELSSLAHKLNNIYDHLRKQLALCQRHIDAKRQQEAISTLKYLMETPHLENMKILRALIYAKDDQLPLFNGSERRRVNLEILRRRIVLLFITDLDISNEEVAILHQMYSEAKQQPSRPESQYEIVWLPIVDRSKPWNETRQDRFQIIQNDMPWYSVHHPSLIDPAVNEFITTEWGFKKQPQLVVLDPQGKVTNLNALHMMWIWGSLAFPFTKLREEALWKEETWRIDLLADSIDQAILNWISQGKYICLYGGENIEWIRRFTRAAKEVARAAGIQLELLYVGKSNPKEKVRRNNSIIVAENLSHILVDVNLSWFFWVRLESMWQSKVQPGMSVENDPIRQEIETMLSFDGSDQEWAVISRGSFEMTKAKGEIMLQSLNNFDLWRADVPTKGFVYALNDYLNANRPEHHCNRLILPGITGNIPERIVCAECGRSMEKFFMYSCCID